MASSNSTTRRKYTKRKDRPPHCRHCEASNVPLHIDRHDWNPDGTDRVYYSCRKCKTTRLRSYSKTRNGQVVRARAASKHNHQFPEKRKARTILNGAIRAGKITRETCRICGAKAQAHHHDYSKPLDVEWLCPGHHADAHKSLSPVAATVIP